MKKILSTKMLLLLLLFTPLFAHSQESKEPESKSKTIEFANREGSLYQKEFEEIGKTGGLTFKNIYITDLTSQQTISALRLENSHYIGSGSSIDYVGTLDSDELEGCIKSLNYLKENLIPTKPTLYTEVEYKSRDGILIGAYCSKGEWKLFVQTKSYTQKSLTVLKVIELDNLINNFIIAKSKLKQ